MFVSVSLPSLFRKFLGYLFFEKVKMTVSFQIQTPMNMLTQAAPCSSLSGLGPSHPASAHSHEALGHLMVNYAIWSH